MRKTMLIGIAMLFLNQTWAIIGPVNPVEKENTVDEFFGFSGWGRKQPITIQAGQVSGSSSHTNFPVLITLDHLNSEVVDGGTNSALNGGGDIRFSSDAAGDNQLAIEVVEFVTSGTPANRKCQIWVKVPSLSATANTTIYIWYNKSGEVQPSASSTYGSQAVWSDYEAVWHMDADPSGTIQDATGNGYSLTSSGGMGSSDLVNGAIGSAIEFDGTDDELSIAGTLPYTSSFTFSAWFNWSGAGSYNGIMANDSPWDGFWVNNAGGGTVVFFDGDDQEFGSDGALSPNNNVRYDFVATSGDFQHYFDSTSDNSGTSALSSGNFAYVGSEGGSAFFSGWIDEIRLDGISRSADWISTEYNNQGTPSSFAVAGTPESVSGGGGGDTQAPTAPTLSSTVQSQTTVDLSWTGATDDTGVTGYKVFKDGVLETTLGNVGTYQVTGLTASTTYSFTVKALDAAANESSASNAVSVTTSSSGGGGGSVWTESSGVANYSGNVAIGTTTVPTGYKLAIDGKLIAEEIKVQLSGNWPDYVFADGYDLPTLEEIKKHIEEKGHLPNIPSAEEVAKNGAELGEMNRLLLEKIEELTLYIIKQENSLGQLSSRIQELEASQLKCGGH